MSREWHLVTGEYPPQRGGVGDYTAMLARGLADQGDAVHVWCLGVSDDPPSVAGVSVHRLGDAFDRRARAALANALDRRPAPRRLLVQYVPNAMGLRGANLPFCFWLLGRARRAGDDVRVMFHEPYFYFAWQSPRRNALAVAHRLMAAVLMRASRVVYMSSASWEPLLRPYAVGRRGPMVWLPVPSTIPRRCDPTAVAAVRSGLAAGGHGPLFGHFGTFAERMTPGLEAVFVDLLRQDSQSRAALFGLNAERFGDDVRARHPDVADRLATRAGLDAADISTHIQACDVMVQPYPEGVTTRRTSLMACLANGAPTVTTTGPLSEPCWHRDAGVVTAPAGDVRALVSSAVTLAGRPAGERRAIGDAGRRLYDERFSLERTLRVLADQPAQRAGQQGRDA